MPTVIQMRRRGFSLVPDDAEALEWVKTCKEGQAVNVSASKPRNGGFHRKYFALLNYAFDNWEAPSDKHEKSRKRFRSDLIILAGYHETVWRLDGTYRVEPKSIAFNKMDQAEFEELYSKTIDVILKHVLNTHTKADIDRVLGQIMEFT